MKIICADSLEWLPAHPDSGALIIGMPDITELGLTTGSAICVRGKEWLTVTDADAIEYDRWYARAATACLLAASPDCPVVFTATDKKFKGKWLDKGYILSHAAAQLGFHTIWHKIEARWPVGSASFLRPGYRHLIAFGKGKVRPGKVTEDIIQIGRALYPNGVCYRAVELAVKLCLLHTDRILDPFCGRGTIPMIAETLGAQATGIDISEEQCAFARALTPDAVEALRTRDTKALAKARETEKSEEKPPLCI